MQCRRLNPGAPSSSSRASPAPLVGNPAKTILLSSGAKKVVVNTVQGKETTLTLAAETANDTQRKLQEKLKAASTKVIATNSKSTSLVRGEAA